LEGHSLDLGQRDAEYLVIENTDLEQPITEDDQFDLAICLEVAARLSAGRAESLVDDLCRLSQRVLFSAAIPGQGGKGHVNEQWQTYWAHLFARKGYVPLDIVRPRIWDNSAIKFWYKQNTLLFCSKESAEASEMVSGLPLLDLVHPELLARNKKLYRQKIKNMKNEISQRS
jgi:hypothetical protein